MIHTFYQKYYRKFIVTSLCLLLTVPHLQAQEQQNIVQKIIKKFVSAKKDSSRSASFMVLPAIGYAQETGFEYGIAGTYDFYMDKEDLMSRTSNLTLIGTLTTKKQKNIKLTSDLWTKNNDYHILSELRYRDWPFNFYGLGNDTWKDDEDYLDQKLYRIKVDAERKIIPNVYAGLNVTYEHFKFQDMEAGGVFESPEVYGKDGGQYLALGASALYDTRNFTNYTTKGLYARIKYAYAPKFFANDDFTGSQTEVDIRGFYPISNKFTLAAQGLYRGTHGKNVPFYVMRDLGGDMTMRGYYLGRYKDKNYLTGQAEIRYRVHPRIGATGFVGAGSTFSDEHKARVLPSYGAGLRYFFSLEHNSSIRFDYSYGEKRPGEKRQSGFYLSISEAF